MPLYAGLLVWFKAVLKLFTPKLLLVLVKNGLFIKARQLATKLASSFFVLSHKPWRRGLLKLRLLVVSTAALLLERFLASPLWFRALCALTLLAATASSAYAFIALLIIPQAVIDWLKLQARALLNKLGLSKALDTLWRWLVPESLRTRWQMFAKWRLGRRQVMMSRLVHQRVATRAKRLNWQPLVGGTVLSDQQGDTPMKIALGCDSAGKPLMDIVEAWLQERSDLDVTNLSDPAVGESELYAEMTDRVARRVASGEFERGILMCGTGLGVCISANKIPGIRAALVHDTYSAERASLSNNAQIITLGARVVGPELAKAVVSTWLDATFDPASHSAANVAAIDALDGGR